MHCQVDATANRVAQGSPEPVWPRPEGNRELVRYRNCHGAQKWQTGFWPRCRPSCPRAFDVER